MTLVVLYLGSNTFSVTSSVCMTILLFFTTLFNVLNLSEAVRFLMKAVAVTYLLMP